MVAKAFWIMWLAALGLAGPQAQRAPAQGPLLLTLRGRGVQVYRCEAAGWVLDHPEAALFDVRQKLVGHHDAGPSWHLDDGGR